MAAPDETCDFDEAMRALGTGAAGEAWRAGWDASQASYPPDGPPFLRERFVRRTCRDLALADDVCEAIAAALGTFRQAPALRRLAWHCHRLLLASAKLQPPQLASATFPAPWPRAPDQLPARGEMLYPLVLLSGEGVMRRLHRQFGVAPQVTQATAGDLELWMRHYRGRHGRWGLAEAGWLANHFLGRIYRLGRLQFRFERFESDFRAFRHRDGRVLLLAAQGTRFRDDGRTIRGQAVSPRGEALRELVELPAGDWAPVLRRGDPVLGVHIPAAGPMTHAACGESFRRAVAFFARHFPGFGWRAFQCGSWLLDNQFGWLLSETANIRRFQEEVYLYPLPGAGDEAMFDRVFGRRYDGDEIASAPRDTALRRAIVDHVLAGGRFRAGGCVLFPEDLDWGRKVYRTS